MWYVSRSQHASAMECMRRRWWEYEVPSDDELRAGVLGWTFGWERKSVDPALVAGGCVHFGIECLLKGVSVDESVGDALMDFDLTCRERGLEGDVPETRALIEALVRAWHRVRLPKWLDEFEVLSIEREELAKLREDVTLQARSDVVVKRKADGSIFVVNWKTTSNADERWLRGWETDMQMATETLAVETRLGQKIAGVIVEGICKGEKRRDKAEDGTVIAERQNSPLIYGWKFPGNPPLEPAAYDWNYTRRKGWGRFKVWEENFGTGIGVKHWVNWLPVEVVEAQFASVPPIMRSPAAIASKAHQIAAFEARTQFAATQLRLDLVMGRDISEGLDEHFPQNERSCNWPKQCPFYDACWRGVSEDMAGSGLYLPRVANHPVPSEVEA